MEDLVKIRINLEPDNILDAGSETLWAKPLGNNIYQLHNSPFGAYGYSYMDKVRAIGLDIPTVTELTESSGHSTYRVILARGSLETMKFKKQWKKLEEIGCTYEGSESKLLSIDVPATTDIFAAYALLEAGESAGIWEFEEAKCAHTTDA